MRSATQSSQTGAARSVSRLRREVTTASHSWARLRREATATSHSCFEIKKGGLSTALLRILEDAFTTYTQTQIQQY